MKWFKTTSLIIAISILILFDTASVTYSARTLPDLSVQSVSGVPASVLSGGTFTITDSIANNGNKLSKAFSVRYYLSLDTIKSKKDILLSGKRQVKSLDYQITSSDVVNLTVPKKTPPGQYYLIACADATKKIKESNEKNNCMTSNTTINVEGDNGNYFPFTEGNTWAFQNTLTENNAAPVSYDDVFIITGLKVINGVTTTVFTESNYRNSGIKGEFYRLKDNYGITYYGNNDTDVVTSQLVPYQEYMFPLEANSSFIQIEKKGINYGEDLDGDGKNESINMSSTVKVEGFETVNVQVGTFSDVAKIVTNITYTLVLSRNHFKYTIKEMATEWFAPGIGPVKRTYIIKYPDKTKETFSSELKGYTIDGQGKGIIGSFTILNDVAKPSTDTEEPGKPSIGFDGTNYLVVSRRVVNWSNSTMIGTIVSGNGSILKTFDISNPGSNRSAVAFDGANYLVVFSRNSQIIGYRISPSGTVIDGPAGFTISTSNPSGATNYLPSVAFDGTNYMVVWSKYDPTVICSGNLCERANVFDIYGARVNPEGQVLGEFPVFSAPGDQYDPSIAFDGTNYFVIWSDTRMESSGFLRYGDIYGARVTKDAVVQDPSGVPISTASGYQGAPQIIFDGTNYFAVWLTVDANSPNISPPPADLYGRRIMPDMTLLDGPLDTGGISIAIGGFSVTSPSVTFDGKDYLVAWSGSYLQYSPAKIYAKRVSIEGFLIDTPSSASGIPISGYPPYASEYLYYPTVLFNGTNSLLTWVNSIFLSGTTKYIEGVLIYPF